MYKHSKIQRSKLGLIHIYIHPMNKSLLILRSMDYFLRIYSFQRYKYQLGQNKLCCPHNSKYSPNKSLLILRSMDHLIRICRFQSYND